MTYPWLGMTGAAAGVGSRDTPRDICDLMTRIVLSFRRRGWTWRTGGADRADEAVRLGASMDAYPYGQHPARLEVYLPRPRWRGHVAHVRLPYPEPMAYRIAQQHHPKWWHVDPAGRDLLARTTHVMLGPDLSALRAPTYDPVRWVLCWTLDGAATAEETSKDTGGTGQAIRLASAYGIPVYNLAREDHRALMLEATR